MPRSANIHKEAIELGDVPLTVTLECGNVGIDILLDNRQSQSGSFSPESFESHDHTVAELFIIEKGHLDIHLGDDIELCPGEMLLIRPRTVHNVKSFSDDILRFNIRFSMRRGGKLIDHSIPPYFKSKFTQNELSLISRLLDELRRNIKSCVASMDLYRLKAQLGIIISYVLERVLNFDGEGTAESDNQISMYTKIENYLYLNYSQQISLESLAAHLSYSRTQMRRIIDNCYGMPFTQKLREIRLMAAKKHLSDGNMSIDEIAEKCGYETRQGFESMFLKHIGVTPNQYRKQHNFQKTEPMGVPKSYKKLRHKDFQV